MRTNDSAIIHRAMPGKIFILVLGSLIALLLLPKNIYYEYYVSDFYHSLKCFDTLFEMATVFCFVYT